MRVLFINSFLYFGSTGRIAYNQALEYEKEGHEVKIAYGRKTGIPDFAMKYGHRIGNDLGVYFHLFYTRLFDKHGLASKKATEQFLKWATEYDPDVLWIHNIHGYFINYEMLFDWIKTRPNMKVKWTLHDCWTFTGHCAHFMSCGCNKWKEQCYDCPQIRTYPSGLFIDSSRENYRRKKAAFTGVNDMTIITPSNWLKNLVKESYLKEYPVQVVYNTINTNIFKPGESDFRKNNHLEKKKILLGVASVWGPKKGLDDLVTLSRGLNPEEYAIVLVGVNKKQIKMLKKAAPEIIAIERTSDVQQLVGLYSESDVFINPTYEDTYPTVNLEAEACGTPVITYNVGGCPETIRDPRSMAIEPGVKNITDALETFFQQR